MQFYTTSNPDVLFDPIAGVGLQAGSKLHAEALAHVASGEAEIVPFPAPSVAAQRRAEYLASGLAWDAWHEAVIEFLGTLPNPTPKFAALWAKRDAVRRRVG
jgi:hypothetical protein